MITHSFTRPFVSLGFLVFFFFCFHVTTGFLAADKLIAFFYHVTATYRAFLG